MSTWMLPLATCDGAHTHGSAVADAAQQQRLRQSGARGTFAVMKPILPVFSSGSVCSANSSCSGWALAGNVVEGQREVLRSVGGTVIVPSKGCCKLGAGQCGRRAVPGGGRFRTPTHRTERLSISLASEAIAAAAGGAAGRKSRTSSLRRVRPAHPLTERGL